MDNKCQSFVEGLINSANDKVLSIEILGSREGEKDISISDVDFLIICRHKSDIDIVFNAALINSERIYNTKMTSVDRFIQRYFLASNSYNGIHLIILGLDEFDNNFQPTSRRLIFLTKLIGRNLFIHGLKTNHCLLYGQNFLDKIIINKISFLEKCTCFGFPIVILIICFPTLFFSQRTLKIWCFKIIKYHTSTLDNCLKINNQDYFYDQTLLNQARYFRYIPDEYRGSTVKLYFATFHAIFKNLPFLFLK